MDKNNIFSLANGNVIRTSVPHNSVSQSKVKVKYFFSYKIDASLKQRLKHDF